MKKTVFLALAFLFLTGLRAPNGEIISSGDPADKLLSSLGRPSTVTSQGVVKVNGAWVRREVWIYRVNKITYRFTVEGGIVVNEEWTR